MDDLSGQWLCEGIRKLETAFGIQSISDARLAIYLEKLEGKLSKETWDQVVEKLIETENRFPSVATILKTIPERDPYDDYLPQGWQKPKDFVYPPNEYYGGMPRLLPGETR